MSIRGMESLQYWFKRISLLKNAQMTKTFDQVFKTVKEIWDSTLLCYAFAEASRKKFSQLASKNECINRLKSYQKKKM